MITMPSLLKEEKDGQQSRFLLLDKLKHLPENEGVSFAEECRNQRTGFLQIQSTDNRFNKVENWGTMADYR